MENNSTDLEVANVVVEKLSETLGILEKDTVSMVSYLEQWGNMERTFERVEASLVERERKIEAKEKGIKDVERLLNEIAVSNGERKLREKEIDERSVVLEERERGIDARQVVLEEREKEIDVKSVGLEALEKQISEKSVVLEERETEIDKKRVMLEERETEIDKKSVVLEEREKEISEKSVVLEEREKEIDKKSVVLEEREKEIDKKSVVLEEREKEIDKKSVVLEEREKEISEKSVVLEERETGIDKKSVMLEVWEKQISEKSVVLEEREMEIDKKSLVLEVWEKQISEKSVVLEEREKEIDKKSVVLEGREKEIEKINVVFNEREKELGEKSVVLEVREKEINKKAVVLEERERLILRNKEMTQVSENLQLMQKKLIEGQRLSNLRERKIVEICKDMELTEARINEGWASLKVEVGVEFKEMETNEGCESRIDQLFKNMDVNGVLSYVVENETELNVCQETLLDYLRLAPTPAKLVLKVIQSFHELGSDNSHGFKGKIGCINLLVGLMKLEEEISASVRKDSEVFAANLGSLVVRKDCSPLDVLCFVQFVVSFKLYDADEILMFLQAFCIGRDVCWPDEHTKFRYKLGLSKKLTALVQSLISREKHLEAVIYICAFEMEDAFSLQPLLDTHFMNIQKTAQETVLEASTSAQDGAAKLELTALRNMLKCISYFKLEPNYSTNSI